MNTVAGNIAVKVQGLTKQFGASVILRRRVA